MNAMCEVCAHHWYDKTGRREVARLFDMARARLSDRTALKELDGLERECAELSEFHVCTFDGMEPVMGEDESDCEGWEAVA